MRDLCVRVGYLCCSIFSFSGSMFLLCMGTLLRLEPRFLPKAKTPESSSNSCFITAALYAILCVVCAIMWRRKLVMNKISTKDPLPSELFGTTMSYYDWDDSEEVAPLVAKTHSKKSPSIQHL
ncbi:hypothetical protein THRCLA_21940 [Thraustotheca clavata]|uniref:Transmembrane protein n=1 Tax=Thraustotheca clavata TaxID=74557 RepID=A0A1V9ZHF8_9STRA|nr:hypothetical protein THRCLA_21940 [Thraustotheca clavata]